LEVSGYITGSGKIDHSLLLLVGNIPWRSNYPGGMRGQYLGGLKLVSNVRKYPAEPRWYHRLITVALGVLSVLFGIGFFISVFVLSAMK
jgi:hypothetical protein